MNSPIIFDTGALIALFNKREAATARKIEGYIDTFPHSARLLYEPNLVELFYKLVQKDKLMSPKDVKTNLDYYGIVVFPLPDDVSSVIINQYMSLSYIAGFDYADFYMCSAAAMRFEESEILTVDRQDFPLALTKALEFFAETGKAVVQPIIF